MTAPAAERWRMARDKCEAGLLAHVEVAVLMGKTVAQVAARAAAEGWSEGAGPMGAARAARLRERLMAMMESIDLVSPEGRQDAKGQMDLIGAIVRVLDRYDSTEPDADAQKEARRKEAGRRDADIGSLLQTIDDRIVELAEAHARELVERARHEQAAPDQG